jgi:hypothetical protein
LEFSQKLNTTWASDPALFSIFDESENSSRDPVKERMFQHLHVVLNSILAVFDGTCSIALQELEKSSGRLGGLPNWLSRVASMSVESLSNLHFITSQYGIDGLDTWKRLLAVLSLVLARSQQDAESAVEMCAPSSAVLSTPRPLMRHMDKARALFLLLLSSQLVTAVCSERFETFVLPYSALFGKIDTADTGVSAHSWKPNADDLDLFDASHSLYLKLFENPSVHRELICRLAPDYIRLLLKVFPAHMSVETMSMCFTTTMQAFGQGFFAHPTSQIVLIRANQHQPSDEEENEDEDKGISAPMERDCLISQPVILASQSETLHEAGPERWQKLDDESRAIAMQCIAMLLDAIDGISSQTPASQGDESGAPSSPQTPRSLQSTAATAPVPHNATSSGTTQAHIPRSLSVAPHISGRLAEILAASPPTAQILYRDHLMIVLFAQLDTVPLVHLFDLMHAIADRMVGPEHGGNSCAPPTSALSLDGPSGQLWQALFAVVSTDGSVDYARRRYLVEWYIDLHAAATKRAAQRLALEDRHSSAAPSDTDSSRETVKALRAKL